MNYGDGLNTTSHNDSINVATQNFSTHTVTEPDDLYRMSLHSNGTKKSTDTNAQTNQVPIKVKPETLRLIEYYRRKMEHRVENLVNTSIQEHQTNKTNSVRHGASISPSNAYNDDAT